MLFKSFNYPTNNQTHLHWPKQVTRVFKKNFTERNIKCILSLLHYNCKRDSKLFPLAIMQFEIWVFPKQTSTTTAVFMNSEHSDILSQNNTIIHNHISICEVTPVTDVLEQGRSSMSDIYITSLCLQTTIRLLIVEGTPSQNIDSLTFLDALRIQVVAVVRAWIVNCNTLFITVTFLATLEK